MAAMNSIGQIAKQHGIVVIEDARTGSWGRCMKARWQGSIGDIGCFSFYAGKKFRRLPEKGGMVVTKNRDYARKVRIAPRLGPGTKNPFTCLRGFNYRLEEIQAAILRVKFAAAWRYGRKHAALLHRCTPRRWREL